jgi:hypothetical protein
MRTWLCAIGLLVLLAPAKQPAQPAPQRGEPDARFYDVTDVVYHRFDEPLRRSRVAPDYERLSDYRPEREFEEPLFGTDMAPGGEDDDRLEELICDIMERVPDQDDDYIVDFVQSGTRILAYVVAMPEAHDLIEFLLDKIRTHVRARIRVTVYEDGKLWGSASGGIGQELCVAHVHLPAFEWGYERAPGAIDKLYIERMNCGREVSMWAVKLPNGRLRVQGSYFERELLGLRPLKTQGGSVEMPEFTSCFQPFVADVDDPGQIDLEVGGRQIQLHVSCGTALPDVERVMPDGALLTLKNHMGLLRRHQQLEDPFQTSMWFGFTADNPVIAYYYGAAESMCDYIWAVDPFKQPGIDLDFYGYGNVYIWEPQELKPAEVPQAEQAWNRLQLWLTELDNATIGRFRISVWQVPETKSQDDPSTFGSAKSSCELTMFEGQAASWQDLSATAYIDEYEIGVGPGVRDSWHDFAAAGDYVSLEWKSGMLRARYAHQDRLGEVEQFDTGLREPGPMIIECPTTRLHELRWFTELKPGEKSASLAPAGDGQVLVGVVERLE